VKTLFGLALQLALCGAGCLTAAAQTAQCGVSLVLAIDVSSSVDAREYQLQMGGLSGALVDPEVLTAIRDVGGIQLTAFEWSGRFDQTDIAPWTFLVAPGDVIDFAERLRDHSRGRDDMPTALGYALGYAVNRFDSAPLTCQRKVIDVSGDGINNEGFEPVQAYGAFDFANVQVNGLAVSGARPDPVSYYRQSVRRGPGAFVVVANGFADYQAAMKRKLIREIRGAALSALER
jgi:hypothetical protein